MSAEINHDRRRFLGSAAMTIAAAQFGMISADTKSSKTVELSSLGSASAWLNSQPLTADGLRGKVVLVQFWTWFRSMLVVRKLPPIGAIALNQANGGIAYRFHARDLHLVMGPAGARNLRAISRAHRWTAPGAARGIDVDGQGNGTLTEQRLYQLIRQPKPIADRQFEIEFLDSGVEAFAFTFG